MNGGRTKEHFHLKDASWCSTAAGSGDRPNEQTVLVAAVAVAVQESSRVRPTGTMTKRRSFSLAGQPGAGSLGAKGEQRRHREQVGEAKRPYLRVMKAATFRIFALRVPLRKTKARLK